MTRHPYKRTMQRGGNQPNRVLSQNEDREACRIAKKIMAEPSAPPGNAAPTELVLHEPRAALRGDQGFIYPDAPPCRIEQPEPCDIPFDCAQGKPARYMSASAERGRKAR